MSLATWASIVMEWHSQVAPGATVLAWVLTFDFKGENTTIGMGSIPLTKTLMSLSAGTELHTKNRQCNTTTILHLINVATVS
jgi:hypothetical protein